MTLKIILLSIIQGVTEFLPISSSGHTIIFGKILGINTDWLLLNVIMHTGSLFAIIIFFFSDILNLLSSFSYKKNKLLYYIITATIPTAIIGLFIKNYYSFMEKISFVSVMLIITGILLLSTKVTKGEKDLNFLYSLIIGVIQGIAAIPGISRSGATISVGLKLGIKKEVSFRFSFLIVIPAIIAAILLEIIDILKNESFIPDINNIGLHHCLIVLIVSFLTSLLSLRLLKSIIKKERIYLFSYYCFLVGILGFIIGG